MNKTFKILTAATERELRFICTLEAEIFSDAWSESSVKDAAESPFYRIFCAETAEGELVGYLISSFIAGEGELLRLAVSNDARKLGIGRALTENFIAYGKELDAEMLFLEHRASNIPAASLYISCGFTEYARRNNYYKNPTEDAVLLQLRLK